jgi:diguanylate cyclase (GGDEF)-like protein/putative nucleotidyltransferase with HDIG domain
MCAVLGVLLVVLAAVLVSSRLSAARSRLDRELVTTAGEKAALVETELERLRALSLVTARIPPFSELYANSDSLAAKIAAVAGPTREINNALGYLFDLYPRRFVEVGYVDVSGRERARVLRGVKTPMRLLEDVRTWPSFHQGVTTPVGSALMTIPFVSPTAHVPVIAATTTVSVNGRVRAYVEIELDLTAVQRVLASDVPPGVGVQIMDRAGGELVESGMRFSDSRDTTRSHATRAAGLRLASRVIAEGSVASGPWVVVAAARAPSAVSAALAPENIVVAAFAVLLLAAAFVGFRRARLGAAQQLAAERLARTEAERLSRVDTLTGLYNRRHAMETIEHELARAGRTASAVGVLMFDVDFFKRINDVHGHTGGDEVLIEVARRLRAGVRSWDTVARVGGEEFCVVAPDIGSEAAAAELGERLRVAIAERAVILGPGVALPTTVSVGVALLHDGEGSAEHAIDCADRALYAAKRRGRNVLRRFSELDQGDLRAEQPECLRVAEALAVAGDLREGLTAQHSREVAALSAAIAERLDLDEDEALRAQLGGWLHDIGKIAVPDGILTKPGSLTDDEWDIIRTHPVVGDELLRHFPELALACDAVRHHHERYDGAGYPDQLAGDAIPVEARIVCVADAYAAMVGERPYQRPRSRTDAIAELRRCAGTQFDPRIVELLADVVECAADASGSGRVQPDVAPAG